MIYSARTCLIFIFSCLIISKTFSEGSKNISPSSNGLVYLQHDDINNISGDFLIPAADADERLYVYIKDGETMYFGLHRLATNAGGTFEDLNILIYNSAGTLVGEYELTNSGGNVLFDSPQAGVIDSEAEVDAGPEFTFNTLTINGGGYDPLSFTNNSGTDQDYYITFVQDEDGATGGYSNIGLKSWYDWWDFSVYEGNEEKPGRLHSKNWSFTTNGQDLSDNFEMYSIIPSEVAGQDAGFYVKKLVLAGMDPFGFLLYANSTGADDDLLNPGSPDGFEELRRSQGDNVASLEYDIFINNPDLEIYPTTILPSVQISNANFYCNAAGTGGEGAIKFTTNQVGFAAILLDLDGTPGFQNGTEDRIIEVEITSTGSRTVRWDGLDGFGAAVPSGTQITITGRFTSAPFHVPLYDVEDNAAGVNLLDVRPATSFNLIYWDDSNVTTNATPTQQFEGTNTTLHTWSGTNELLINTWSFGYYQANSQLVTYSFDCDTDNDTVDDLEDDDLDNDGVPNSDEGDIYADADGDNIPDYLDSDFPGFTDENGDGVDDNFDFDQDGIPNALDLDSDNDGVPDVEENGFTDADGDGEIDCAPGTASAFNVGLTVTDNDANSTTHNGFVFVSNTNAAASVTGSTGPPIVPVVNNEFYLEAECGSITGADWDINTDAAASGGEFAVWTGGNSTGSQPADNSDNYIRFTINVTTAGFYEIYARVDTDNSGGNDSFWVRVDGGTSVRFNDINGADGFLWEQVYDSDDGNAPQTYNLSVGTHTIDFFYRENGAKLDQVLVSLNTAVNDTDPPGTGVNCENEPNSTFTITSTSGTNPFTVNFDGSGSSDADGTITSYDWDFDDGNVASGATSSNVFTINGSNGDNDNNGQCDITQDPNLVLPDRDDDGVDDYLDIDSDNDGIVDVIEAGGTASSTNGRINNFTDADGNGWNDAQEIVPLSTPDTDGDGVNDINDIDSDNDGIRDNIEAQSSSAYISPTTADSDGDGLFDIYDPDNGGTFLNPVNTDGTGNPDYRDTDADGDGVEDIIEGWDSNKDGISDLDVDQDGDVDNTDAADIQYDCPGLLRADNPDLENGLAGLTSFSNDSTFVTNDAQSGDAAIAITSTNGGAGISDFLNVRQDSTLRLRAFAKLNSGNSVTYASIGVTFWDETRTTRVSEPQIDLTGIGSTYSQYILNTTVPANAFFAEVYAYKLGGVNDTLYVDNFCLINTSANTMLLSDDSNNDGLLDIFEPFNATLQNTDGGDESDWQDTDDDNDGNLTSGEDYNSNSDWSDDFTQGGGTTPDYLYKGDYDDDAIPDATDLDSDNDGILDTDEANGESVDPSQDSDGDGIPNYKDPNIASQLSSAVDLNGDGVFDVFDTDLDGVPDYLDLDADNDGIFDGIEANGGAIPNGFNTTTGQFNLQDPDNDGLMNFVDSDDVAIGGTSTLLNPDTDVDGIPDYKDIDADDDGIPDIREAQSTSGYQAFSGIDVDGDGMDDAFDPNQGGTLTLPVNTDGLDLQDYRDDDSDNDNIPDIVDGNDTDRNGVADVSLAGNDEDGDGLDDNFDTDSGGTTPALQNTDGTDEPDWRDTDDDNDGELTIDEDANDNGDYTDDQTDGQGISFIPDYLFWGDIDGDGVPDNIDIDDDNDGILDVDEGYENVNLLNGSFEEPDVLTTPGSQSFDGGNIKNYDEANVPGWFTTAGDDLIELWDETNTIRTHAAYEGNQWAEINANSAAQLYQDIATEPGTLLYWQIAHRGRSGTDDFRILIGPTTGPVDNGTFSTGNGAWQVYSGYYEVPQGQTITRLGFEAVGGGSTGNFIDNFIVSAVVSGGDADGDGIPNYQDLDSDNDGIPDIVEAGWVDADGDGTVDTFVDTDGDGWADVFDPDNAGTPQPNPDSDGDGIVDIYDIDSDNDGTPDIIEANGVDVDGDGKLDGTTDTDNDGYLDIVDSDNGGTPLTIPDTDNDNVQDYKDLDSDNDGITDAVENGSPDTDNDGIIDTFATDTDNDGLADSVDGDNGGTPLGNVDTDGDGINDYRDLDSDNDGYPDILEGGGTDSDFDGRLDNMLDTDEDGIQDAVDVTQTGGTDADADGIDDAFDVDYTGGQDTDGDGIDNQYDVDFDGDGFDDETEANPFSILDTDGDGNKNFRDLDSDNDGIPDVTEFDLTIDAATASIASFTDTNSTGWNDAQEGSSFTLLDSDSDGIADFVDLDSDDDGIVDNLEAQTKATYRNITGNDTNDNGLDDNYDPTVAGGVLLVPVDTDAATDPDSPDYLDDDSDGDSVPDVVEGDNPNRRQYAAWDTNDNNDPTDEADYPNDTDDDGIRDLFDDYLGTGIGQVLGSGSAVQDSDRDGIWDFQDVDDDNDGDPTIDEDDDVTNNDPTDDFIDDSPLNRIPDYLFGQGDIDGDGINDNFDLDSDNDGLRDIDEDGGTGIDPSGDIDNDGLLNYEDDDMDGDGLANGADTDADGNTVPDTWSKADANSDGILDVFDADRDGVADFRDKDSDNDGIFDLIELGLTDANGDGTLDEGAGITDLNGNGLDDNYDPECDGSTSDSYAIDAISQTGSVTLPGNAIGAPDATSATIVGDNSNNVIQIDMGFEIPSGEDIFFTWAELSGNPSMDITLSTDNIAYSAGGSQSPSSGTLTEDTYTLTANARYIRIANTTNQDVIIDAVRYNGLACNGNIGTALTTSDRDGDGISNHLDLDSDDDGIPDIVEAQTTAGYVAPNLTDVDRDGVMDVFDALDNRDFITSLGGTAITLANTDAADSVDYLDLDSDNDGVPDVIEAYDTDEDGFGDWDNNSNNDETDETGYGSDVDGDGIRFIFDDGSTKGTLANLTGANYILTNTDGDAEPNFRDTDDDGDGDLTSVEDFTDGSAGGPDGDWTNDFTQGGAPTPDYLYNPDQDEDGLRDDVDIDSDNDGIPNSIEFNGTDPFGDDDADNIYNYLDPDYAGFIDVNGDNLDDRVDQDRDGVPDFFDLDSDNDGILDAIEANNGLVPTGFDTSTGRYPDNDTDNDGLVNQVDTDNGGTPLPVQDFDSDGLEDYLDLDSDNDGITDYIEGQTTAGLIALSGNDDDRDGIDNAFDTGSAIVPLNFDGDAEPDYRDLDTDDDGVGDIIEGYDANRNGFSELDTDLDGLLSDQLGHGADTDNDGIWDLFDSFTGRGVSNVNGTYADLQNTDLTGDVDFRDVDDDDDNIPTASEDVNNNNDWTDDKVQGGGATPDYLFFNDTDKDGIADGIDLDGDNDGIADSEEYDSANPDPFGDEDGDGLFNYTDKNDPALSGLTDSNNDGVWDEYDNDLDGFANFFDLDSDNDGLPDALEANSGTMPANMNTQGQLPQDMTGNDTDNDGLWDAYDVNNSGTALANPDTDGDGINDIYDLDSDNDGLVDLVEGGGNDFDGSGTLDSFGDTDGDGLGNNVDPDNGGTPLAVPNTDGAGDGPDYLDKNSDDDSLLDYDEGFDDDEDGTSNDDYTLRATNYGNVGKYDPGNLSWLANFLTPGSPNYYDSDNDGLIDLFDPDNGGVRYGGISGRPDNNSNGVANVLENDGSTPLPLDFLSFTGHFDNGNVRLDWETTNEIDVSHFEIEWSTDGQNFNVIGNLDAFNEANRINQYSYIDKAAVQGFNYYRLRQIDFDGAYDYSKTILVLASEETFRIVIYPNPSSDFISIEGNVPLPTGEFALINMAGQTLRSGQIRSVGQKVLLDIRSLQQGIYHLIFDSSAGKFHERVIIR